MFTFFWSLAKASVVNKKSNGQAYAQVQET